MCGILISKSSDNKIIDSISHRGIEKNVMWVNGVNLCHHRLPIQTVEGDSWSQPKEISNGIFLLYNGEIFNYDQSYHSSDSAISPVSSLTFLANESRSFDKSELQ